MNFKLGTRGDGSPLECDLQQLIDTRLLVQANSGGGKSYTIRRLLEQTHGHVQHLVIDPEGEFASLRGSYDYVLAARSGGDTAADPRSARLLAERLLELGVSAILDIYELKAHERIRFVRLFLEALVEAPKKLWHPVLIVLDEAHVFAPQVGEAESAGAVIDLATRGRKRGFSALLATQRLSKLHKDAAAECNNKLIGRTGLDVDVKRAADELGLTGREEQQQLRTLSPGEFFVYGPALSPTVDRVVVGKVRTSHPKAGARLAPIVPPPTAKIRGLLPKLADLPAEVEKKALTEAELRKRIAELERELRAKPASTPAPAAKEKRVEVPVVRPAEVKRLEDMVDRIERAKADLAKIAAVAIPELARGLETAVREFSLLVGPKCDGCAADAPLDEEGWHRHANGRSWLHCQRGRKGKLPPAVFQPAPPMAVRTASPRPERAPVAAPARRARADPAAGSDLPRPQQRILDALAWLESVGIPQPSRTQLALWCEVSPTSGGYFNNLGALRTAGLIQYPSGGSVTLSDTGRAGSHPGDLPQTAAAMQDALYRRVRGAKEALLRELVGRYPKPVSREELADAVGVSRTSGGYFNNLGALRTLGVIDYPTPGQVVALPVLFLEA